MNFKFSLKVAKLEYLTENGPLIMILTLSGYDDVIITIYEKT